MNAKPIPSGRAMQAPSEYWNPEDETFWETRGRRVAIRNLCISIPALHLSFAVWLLWSAVVVKLGDVGFAFSPDQTFMLAAAPGLAGATLRLPMTFVVPIFGGRNVSAAMTAALLLPTVGLGLAIQDPRTSFTTFLLLGVLAGFGGGNFSASMSNISYFFPKKQQGTALGLNAGLGNLGVSMTQFVTPLIITLPLLGAAQLAGGKALYLQNAAFFWVPFILATAIAAAIGMDNLPIRNSLGNQLVVLQRKHTWLMTALYMMTFGSFIGFSAAFPLLIKVVFGHGPDAPNPLAYAWLGPLVGSLARPAGGWLADKLGGARVTQWSTVATMAATGLAIHALGTGSFAPFLAAFLALFVTTGVGNGSTFRMIPNIFPAQEAGPVLGFTAALAAYGAFLIPQAFGMAIKATGSPAPALWGFMGFYALCLGLNWWFYARRGAECAC